MPSVGDVAVMRPAGGLAAIIFPIGLLGSKRMSRSTAGKRASTVPSVRPSTK